MITFYGMCESHISTFNPILPHLESEWEIVVPIEDDRGAIKACERLSLPYRPLGGWYRMLVCANDWDNEVRHHLNKARVTVCLQEGPIYNIRNERKMEHCQYQLLMGPYWKRFWPNGIIVGNPRFDTLHSVPLPQVETVMINCNFTTVEHDRMRTPWIQDVIEVCEKRRFRWFISRHPRDFGDIRWHYKQSSPAVVHNHLANATVLVSRFSTLILEALLMGRKAVYYDPFNEGCTLFSAVYPHTARTKEELERAILQNLAEDEFINQMVYQPRLSSGRICAETLEEILAQHPGHRVPGITMRMYWLKRSGMLLISIAGAKGRWLIQSCSKSIHNVIGRKAARRDIRLFGSSEAPGKKENQDH